MMRVIEVYNLGTSRETCDNPKDLVLSQADKGRGLYRNECDVFTFNIDALRSIDLVAV
jgi:hypothetical protein